MKWPQVRAKFYNAASVHQLYNKGKVQSLDEAQHTIMQYGWCASSTYKSGTGPGPFYTINQYPFSNCQMKWWSERRTCSSWSLVLVDTHHFTVHVSMFNILQYSISQAAVKYVTTSYFTRIVQTPYEVQPNTKWLKICTIQLVSHFTVCSTVKQTNWKAHSKITLFRLQIIPTILSRLGRLQTCRPSTGFHHAARHECRYARFATADNWNVSEVLP